MEDDEGEDDGDFEVTRVRLQTYAMKEDAVVPARKARAPRKRSGSKTLRRSSTESDLITEAIVTGTESLASTKMKAEGSAWPTSPDLHNGPGAEASSLRHGIRAISDSTSETDVKNAVRLRTILDRDPTPVNSVEVPVPDWLVTKALLRLPSCVVCKVPFKPKQSGPARWVSLRPLSSMVSLPSDRNISLHVDRLRCEL